MTKANKTHAAAAPSNPVSVPSVDAGKTALSSQGASFATPPAYKARFALVRLGDIAWTHDRDPGKEVSKEDGESFAALAEDIKLRGVKEPVDLTEEKALHKSGDELPTMKHTLFAGRRRCDGALLAFGPDYMMPCMLWEGTTEEDRLGAAFRENFLRKNLTVCEKVSAVEAYYSAAETRYKADKSVKPSKLHGLCIAATVAQMACSPAHAENMVRVKRKLSPESWALLLSGKLGLKRAFELASLSHKDQAKDIENNGFKAGKRPSSPSAPEAPAAPADGASAAPATGDTVPAPAPTVDAPLVPIFVARDLSRELLSLVSSGHWKAMSDTEKMHALSSVVYERLGHEEEAKKLAEEEKASKTEPFVAPPFQEQNLATRQEKPRRRKVPGFPGFPLR